MNEQVYHSLRGDILAGKFEGGQQLLQKELAERYRVSRIPVREALSRLSSEGLVVLVPYKGAAVASFSISELREIFEIRFALESLMLRHVVLNITEEAARRVHDLLVVSTREPLERRSRKTHWNFHSALYEIAGKPRLLEMIKSQYDKVDRYMQIYLARAGAQEQSFRSHDAILQACRAGDTVEATMRLHEHMMAAVRRLDSFLSKKTEISPSAETFALCPPLIDRARPGRKAESAAV